MRERAGLVERDHPLLSVRRQCLLLGVTRSSLGYEAVAESAEDHRIKGLLDRIYPEKLFG